MAGAETVAVLEFSHDEPLGRDATIVYSVSAVAGQLGSLVRRIQSDDRRSQEAEHLQQTCASERAARIEAESALRQATAASRARDTSVSTLAHDLKTPLASLSWHVQMLDRNLRRGNLQPSSFATALEPIGAAAAQAVSATDELYDLTRMWAAHRFTCNANQPTWSNSWTALCGRSRSPNNTRCFSKPLLKPWQSPLTPLA